MIRVWPAAGVLEWSHRAAIRAPNRSQAKEMGYVRAPTPRSDTAESCIMLRGFAAGGSSLSALTLSNALKEGDKPFHLH